MLIDTSFVMSRISIFNKLMMTKSKFKNASRYYVLKKHMSNNLPDSDPPRKYTLLLTNITL